MFEGKFSDKIMRIIKNFLARELFDYLELLIVIIDKIQCCRELAKTALDNAKAKDKIKLISALVSEFRIPFTTVGSVRAKRTFRIGLSQKILIDHQK